MSTLVINVNCVAPELDRINVSCVEPELERMNVN
jgi:hypothetical protein